MTISKGEILRRTNQIWNDSELNQGWSVGYVSSLINKGSFSSYDEWKEFYFESGRERLAKLSELNKNDRLLANNPIVNPRDMIGANPKIYDLNNNYGRTQQELVTKAFTLMGMMIAQGTFDGMRVEHLIWAVEQRVLKDTYEGIVLRERNTISTLEKALKGVEFKALEGAMDSGYAVDYEMFYNGSRVCGLQIKPKSYMSKKPYILEAKKYNAEKNKRYEDKYGAKVLYVYSDKNGYIYNKNIIAAINDELFNKMSIF